MNEQDAPVFGNGRALQGTKQFVVPGKGVNGLVQGRGPLRDRAGAVVEAPADFLWIGAIGP
ncbi:MAG: hypothetical protein O7G83_18895 [Proteobacteria bacterium]|nr:hypothetical protein [Pseudomonadota bacterium]